MAELALGMGLVGSALTTNARVQSAKSNANLSEMEAQSLEQAAQYNAMQANRQHKLAQGSANAQVAASGVSVSSGSPLFMELDRVKQGALDVAAIKRSGDVAASGKRYEGQLYKSSIPGIYAGGVASAGTALGTFLQNKGTFLSRS